VTQPAVDPPPGDSSVPPPTDNNAVNPPWSLLRQRLPGFDTLRSPPSHQQPGGANNLKSNAVTRPPSTTARRLELSGGSNLPGGSNSPAARTRQAS